MSDRIISPNIGRRSFLTRGVGRWNLMREKVHTALSPRLVGFECGAGTRLLPGSTFNTGGGRIRLGRSCIVHDGARILAYGGEVTLGDRCSVNPYSILYGHGGLAIGNGVLIAAHVVIIPANHNIALDSNIRSQGITALGIVIEDDVWIGAGARILDRVHIESGAVVAAGSVVTSGRVPANTIVGGVPAGVIGYRE